jgi:glycosyltransferase involved in cell wall biosynthesis
MPERTEDTGEISHGLHGAEPGLARTAFQSRTEAGIVPLVSVITIFLNTDRFIREAIESVLGQDFTNFELILVDDGSTDGSSSMARGYAQRFPEQIIYLEHEDHGNRGMSASRNLGIRHARGTYITFCDADDVWMPGKLAEQQAIFRDHHELGMVCCAANYWRSWTGGNDRIVLSGHVQNAVVRPPAACLAVDPLGGAVAPCNDVLVRRDVVLQVGGFEEEFWGMYEDQAFLAKIYLATPVYFSSRVSLKYRQHPESCMAIAERDGRYNLARRHFLEWFAGYVRLLPEPKPIGVEAAIQRALLAYRRPLLYLLLTMPRWAVSGIRRLLSVARSVLIRTAS